MLEMSKHSITRGSRDNCSASAKALTSAAGSTVLGSVVRVNRRVARVVWRRSSSMLRNSAAFSKSIFSVCIRAKVTRAVVFSEAREAKTRPFLCQIDLNEQEAFIITKRNIIAWPIFLDQLAFE